MRFPFLRSKPASKDDGPAPVAEPGSVQLARIHARRRLVGALVLLVAGIAVFPVLFETQPRPIAVDTPIVMPTKDTAPAARGPVTQAPVKVLPADAGVEGPAIGPVPAASEPLAARPAEVQADAVAAPPTAAPAPSAAKPPVVAAKPALASSRPGDDGARAQALLEARTAASAPAPGTSRFVVQAGAYSEAGALRDARQKVEKLGLKTYTQVVDSDTGKRTRVRVGPFATRQEAEGAAAKVKAAGLQVSILAL
jgi:DedD protein